jgi:hypothetical protein
MTVAVGLTVGVVLQPVAIVPATNKVARVITACGSFDLGVLAEVDATVIVDNLDMVNPYK